MAKLRIRGAWIGELNVELEQWSLSMLRNELAKHSDTDPNSIKLFYAGRVLEESEENPNLAEIGVKNNAKVYFSRINFEAGQQFQEEEQHTARLALLEKVVAGVGKTYTDADHYIEIQDRSGQEVYIEYRVDRRSAMMGLLFHARAKQLIQEQSYIDAVNVLRMGEEAFHLCSNSGFTEFLYNVHGLQIDIVWCYFMLRDESKLSDAAARLAKARKDLQKLQKDSHVLLQGEYLTHLAMHLRLELLEGVVAYHYCEIDKCRELLISAQEKLSKLQVSDAAKRALKMTNQNVENIETKKEIKYECEHAAVCLESNGNKRDKLIDSMTSLDVKSFMKRFREEISEEYINLFISMGFERSKVISAVAIHQNNEGILMHLLGLCQKANNGGTSDKHNLIHLGPSTSEWMNAGIELVAVLASREKPNIEECSTCLGMMRYAEQRIADTEIKLAADLQKEGIDVTTEAEAINTYLALLHSSSSWPSQVKD